MTSAIEIKGLDKLKWKMQGVMPAVKVGIKAGTLHVKGKVAIYPKATIANDPSQQRWYERGWGSKWHLKSGGWHGKKSSEMLGKKWTIEIRNDGLTGVIGNNVSYGPYVQSPDKQASALKKIGWKTTEEVAEEEKETVLNGIKAQVDKALQKG